MQLLESCKLLRSCEPTMTVTLRPETARLHCDSLADYLIVTAGEYHTPPPSLPPVSGIVFHIWHLTRQHGQHHTASTYNGLDSIRPRPSFA